jgi:exopolyphosphatase / guanosine-5'-triphosphate,3'-diphosphate pyrophosphatase
MSLHTLAAVDLGSNSFHLQIARIVDGALYPLDNLKETVRLGAGVTPDKDIDTKTAERAFNALRLFADRLRGMPKENVRVVGTNALRIAKNAHAFVREAEALLGFPIEVIAGREEARLIYLGVAKSLPPSNHDRLVVDIGGGSTEFIIGYKSKPKLVDSLYMGCVSYSSRYFANGEISKRSLREAQLAARQEIEQIRSAFLKEGWREAYGSSGTARALASIISENVAGQNGITLDGLYWLRDRAIRAGNFSNLGINIKADRIPVMAGGLAIMLTIFEELELQSMQTVDTALRDGVLHDMLGRTHQADHLDVRDMTVAQLAKRFHVDTKQSDRVRAMARHFWSGLISQMPPRGVAESTNSRLEWAGQLHEIGMSIAQAGMHKHSAYVLAQADMPGFSKRDQSALSKLVLAQRGKLAKLGAGEVLTEEAIREILCLRLAVLLSRSRRTVTAGLFALSFDGASAYTLTVNDAWLSAHDLADYELQQEVAEWQLIGVSLSIKRSIANYG